MDTARDVQLSIRKQSDKKRAQLCARYFKTGKGEYAYGDVFAGLTMPMQRAIAKRFKDLPTAAVGRLLRSKIHEERMVALLIIVDRFERSSTEQQRAFWYNLYIKNKSSINNWDLVDVTAHKVVGRYLEDKQRTVLYRLAKSKILWDRRIAIISTAWFIKQKDFVDTLALARLLLADKHDLIHKAVGWMLREVGKQEEAVLHDFLRQYASRMPRTCLRYAIEKFAQPVRLRYLASSVT